MPFSIMPQSSTRSIRTEASDVTERTATKATSIDFAELRHPNEKPINPTGDVESSFDLSHINIKAVTRKVDFRVMPMIMMLYMFSFLDRVNIGNARLMGFEEDLGLVGNQYQIAVSVFFVTYCITEVPSNLLIKKIGPNYFLPTITIGWGIIASCTAACQNFTGLIVIRLLLGAIEAGLMPGLILYLTMFYTRWQLGLRTALLYCASPLAGVLGGLIAYGVEHIDGAAGLRGWRWLMIIEGAPTILLGIAAYFVLPAPPEKAAFLSHSERCLLLAIRRSESGQTASAQHFHWKDVISGLKDWQIWLLCITAFAHGTISYGFSTFLPTIIKAIGKWNAGQTQALTVPVYAAGVIVYLIMAWVSDRIQQRGLLAATFNMIAVAGYGMLIANHSAALSYAGCFVIAIGLYTGNGLPLAWLPNNKPRWAKRAYTIAIWGAFANMGGCTIPFLFKTQDGPQYTTAYAVSMGLNTAGSAIMFGLSCYYRRMNKRRAMGWEDWRMNGKTEEEIEAMGDDSPRFQYQP
ncbi:hypothetical protein AC578_608 [Pseudocercospora eumusae]|uniref:Major facilitator superfamily (MFS) profile domain-containing protein n=1 Tax=Pseudocercospora eumusae TaxID=321146 RepID=A0A139HFI4_9PEZI|nr:hypothetical protein AC578_608 [Pseudocercospora eumusae]KXT01153.1 hypothetical protein AC578_608 [Pseudocercospora eumusae]